jgi:hypothetical protein
VVIILFLVNADNTAQSNCQVCRVLHLSDVYISPDRPRSPGRGFHPIRESVSECARYECLIFVGNSFSSLFSFFSALGT